MRSNAERAQRRRRIQPADENEKSVREPHRDQPPADFRGWSWGHAASVSDRVHAAAAGQRPGDSDEPLPAGTREDLGEDGGARRTQFSDRVEDTSRSTDNRDRTRCGAAHARQLHTPDNCTRGVSGLPDQRIENGTRNAPEVRNRPHDEHLEPPDGTSAPSCSRTRCTGGACALQITPRGGVGPGQRQCSRHQAETTPTRTG